MLAGLQHHLVQAQTEDRCCRRRRCQRCRALRPIKDSKRTVNAVAVPGLTVCPSCISGVAPIRFGR